MSHTESDPTAPDAGRTVDTLDRALRDASIATRTRRWLLERAAMGAAAVAAASALIPSGEALGRSHRGLINEWGAFASTTEALTVTLTSELVRRASKHPEVPSSVSAIFDAVYAAERDHWRFTSKHWRPSTSRFWIPDGFLTNPSTACSGKLWPAQARRTISDSRSSNSIVLVRSRLPLKALASASASGGRPPVASTTSRGLWRRRSRSARINHDNPNATQARPAGVRRRCRRTRRAR